MADLSRIYVGLDLGTTKICTVIAEVAPDGELRIIGVGTSASDGLRRGVVVDVVKTVQSISRAVAGERRNCPSRSCPSARRASETTLAR